MKVEQLVAYQEQLKTLSGLQLEDMQLLWDLTDAYAEAEKALEKFHKARETYVKEHGKEDPNDPQKFIITDQAAFEAYLKKLLDVEVKINFPKITLESLKGQKVSVSEMSSWKKLGLFAGPEKPKKKDAVK